MRQTHDSNSHGAIADAGAAFRMASFYKEAARRAALAGEARPKGVKGPPLRHFLGELSAFAEPLRRLGRDFPIERTDEPRTVMLLPGFATHPVRMRYMAQQLERAGHKVKRWGLGFNLGPTEQNITLLERRLAALNKRYGRPVVLVGWSLGGLFARELARRHPDMVAKVITMGSPFSGSPRANNAWRLYHLVTGHPVEAPPIDIDLRPSRRCRQSRCGARATGSCRRAPHAGGRGAGPRSGSALHPSRLCLFAEAIRAVLRELEAI